MDAALLEKDLVACLRDLPTEFVKDASKLFLSHDLGPLFPKVMERLAPHIRTIAFEAFSGQLDTKELEETVKTAVRSIGIVVPDAPNP